MNCSMSKTLQQVVDDYYDKHPMEVMSRLEHQTTDIMNIMYDSVTNDNFDRVSGVVDKNYDKTDTGNEQMPYDYDNDTATGEMKQDTNMTNKLEDVGMKDMVPYKRDDNMTKAKWSIETSDVGNDFMREYDNMCKSMEDRQINDFMKHEDIYKVP